MRALHYSIIAISLIGISFFISEDAYGCLGNCPPIIPPPHYASPPITVHTNLENYSTGDNIIIVGHVFNQTKDTPLMIKIYDPIRQLQFDKNVSVSSDGSYTWTLSTVDFWSFNASGNYTVLSQYGQVYAITNFNLNSTLTQYLYAQSPLWQFKNGMSAQDVHCHAGLTLIIRKENFAPACTHPITATKLILSGWALGTPPIKRFISDIDISGLQKNYTVGQPIDATVNYVGYWSVSWEPDVKIFDANDTQIWFNCPNCVTNDTILGGGPHFPSYGNFTYHVRDHNGHLPTINETGTYTMVVSLANKTASAEFKVVKPTLPNGISGLENDVGIVTFGNRTYYFETPHYTQDAYVNPVHISFHGVVFTLFPSGFRGGLPTLCTNNPEELQYYWADAKFVDSSHELLHILGVSPPCPARPIPSMFSTNTDPLAGLTFYDGKLKLLVSVEGKLQQNNSVFSTPIQTNETIYHDFPQPRGYSIINSTQGIIVNNDAEASNLTGFSVKSPTYLPQGYKVQLIKASKEIPVVTIFVSKYPLTDNITSHDFLWNQQGILITYQQVAPHELEYFNQLFYGPEDKIIRINGTLAVISDISKQYHNGYAYDMWGNLLAIQNNDTNLAIRGFFNSDDLIKIATSMLEK